MNEAIIISKQGDRCQIIVQFTNPDAPHSEQERTASITLPKGGIGRLVAMLTNFQQEGVQGYSGSIRLGISDYTVTENVAKVVRET